jgi:FkbM family methyltransferase
MTRQPLPAAPSDHFRSRGFVETAGERFRSAPLGSHIREWAKRAYYAALMLQTGGRGLPCRLPDGERLRALPEHRYLSWNPQEYAAFKRAVSPGMVALDVGANVGAYSMLLGQWVGPTGRVFAFEPAPSAFHGLVRHLRLNDLSGVVRAVHAAAGDRETQAEFLIMGTAGEGRLAAPADGDGARVNVPVVTIDAFCAREGIDPDFIKIDVEGWELAVLRGARETIRRRGRALALFVEMHPSAWPHLATSRESLLDELRAQRLEPVSLGGTDDLWAIEGVALELRHF